MNLSPKFPSKYLYIDNTPAWKVRALYIFGIFSWIGVIYGFRGMVLVDPFYTWFVTPVIFLITLYHILSFGVNATFKKFNIKKHEEQKDEFWKNGNNPTVDVFLPICGESIKTLKNTWQNVANLNYKNLKVYVLDDSVENCERHRKIAESFGFIYFERPNKGQTKKAGNLKYAFERTGGEFIAIFDADFAPHPDFLKETLPYTINPKIGIVQTPQYFNLSEKIYKDSPLSIGPAYQEELFYRVMQVAKDRFNAAICCGSNAVYRRSALDEIGGPRQVTASEDSRTGFALLDKGYITRYIPLILAIGLCPNNVYSYYHQQHRWCRGRSELVLSKEFLTAKVSFMAKVINFTGFLSFLLRPLEILLSFQLFWVLFLYNDFITLENSVIFYLYLIFSLVLIPKFHITKYKVEVLLTSSIQAFAATHSILSVVFGRSVSWIATNSKHTNISRAFKQTFAFVLSYLLMIISLTLLGFRSGDIHIFDIKYWSVQFWILYNLTITFILTWQLFSTIRKIKTENNYIFELKKLNIY